MLMQTLLAWAGAYLLGSFSTGYYLVRWRCGLDVRTLGSGTTGAFNVARVLKTPGFVVTLLGDVLKGALAVALAQWWGLETFAQLGVMLAVVLGHDFPPQLGFRGGNGLATASGALLILDPSVALALAMLFGLSLPVLAGLKMAFNWPIRYYTPSKVTVVAAPFVALALGRAWWLGLGLGLTVAIILWTIRGNLRRLQHAA